MNTIVFPRSLYFYKNVGTTAKICILSISKKRLFSPKNLGENRLERKKRGDKNSFLMSH
ncbi:hypothetical protein LEP1GSC037_4181 [Leptospira interrogans str. 2006001854]|uniref:Uncharacterized protein n=1 Tax=Leptospira interrogans str. 2006001854 TaxID=1001590 RepID=M6GG24_LEPIR|nr:hypothetical protein LEP1GSC037_4181 [Leptospira interrogans str. 2006001854]